jgi:hypothetical protein
MRASSNGTTCLERHHLLAGHVPAFLRSHLILDHDGRSTCTHVFPHRALHVERIAIARITIADDEKIGRGLADAAQLIGHFGKGDESRIGHAEPGARDRKAAHERGLETRLMREPGRECIPTGRRHEMAGAQPLPEP